MALDLFSVSWISRADSFEQQVTELYSRRISEWLRMAGWPLELLVLHTAQSTTVQGRAQHQIQEAVPRIHYNLE